MVTFLIPDIIHYFPYAFRVFLHLRGQGDEHLFGALVGWSGAMLLDYLPDSLVVVKYRAGSQCIVGVWGALFYALEEW